MQSDERRFYCLLTSDIPPVEEYFNFRVPAVLDEALTIPRSHVYKNFVLKVQVDVGYHDNGNPFPTEAELESFSKKYLKKLEFKVLRRIDAQKMLNRPGSKGKLNKGTFNRKNKENKYQTMKIQSYFERINKQSQCSIK